IKTMPSHILHVTTAWLHCKRVRVLDWPSCSPDLSPIENVWPIKKLRVRPSCPTSVSDLTNALLEEWSKISVNTFLTLVESLPRRVEAVIASFKFICV
uniref:Tc1-like transposase DDE domain-containing protein n=1 Tax=Pygocentrus nattereri TaxID=42514 RepID=A0A3B4DAI0_PYGNA